MVQLASHPAYYPENNNLSDLSKRLVTLLLFYAGLRSFDVCICGISGYAKNSVVVLPHLNVRSARATERAS